METREFVSPVCIRCKSMICNLTHSFWSCSNLYTYWKNLFYCFSEAFGKHWEPDPLIAILGATSSLSSANKYEKKAVLFGMVVAKKLILRVWKLEAVPMYDLWLSDIENPLYLERLRLYNEDRGDVFDKIWDPVLNLFRGKE